MKSVVLRASTEADGVVSEHGFIRFPSEELAREYVLEVRFSDENEAEMTTEYVRSPIRLKSIDHGWKRSFLLEQVDETEVPEGFEVHDAVPQDFLLCTVDDPDSFPEPREDAR